jgi:RND superfamily putative drug exporter
MVVPIDQRLSPSRPRSRQSLAEMVTDLLGPRRWTVLLVWALVLVVAGIGGRQLPAELTGGGWSVSGSESALAAATVRDGFLARGDTTVTLVVRDERYTADQPQFAERVRSVMADLGGRADLDVTGSYGWATLGAGARDSFVGDDDSTAVTYLALGLADGVARRVLPEVQVELVDRYAGGSSCSAGCARSGSPPATGRRASPAASPAPAHSSPGRPSSWSPCSGRSH